MRRVTFAFTLPILFLETGHGKFKTLTRRVEKKDFSSFFFFFYTLSTSSNENILIGETIQWPIRLSHLNIVYISLNCVSAKEIFFT